jgi:hypothetical protein
MDRGYPSIKTHGLSQAGKPSGVTAYPRRRLALMTMLSSAHDCGCHPSAGSLKSVKISN